jgi:VanZ family protein
MGSIGRYRSDKTFLLAAGLTILFIVYGSLYPFSFARPADGIGPVRVLIESRGDMPLRGDFLANILLYFPLGFFGALAIAHRVGAWRAILLATTAGALLSTAMELAQYYVQSRVTAANDVYANLIGTMLGAAIAGIICRPPRWLLNRDTRSDLVPCLLIALWLGYRLFPFVPTIDLHKYWHAVKPLVLYPNLTGYDLVRHTAVWLTVGALVEAIAGRKRAWLMFPLFIGAVLFAKLLIISKTLSMAEVAGAGSALCLWGVLAAVAGLRLRVGVIALIFLAYVIAERLAPFQFTSRAVDFGWVPFHSFMYGSLEVNIMSFFEKAFAYGSLIWLLGITGLGFRRSTILVATMLFATSWAEIYLPNRSSQITDALMALLIGAFISAAGTDTGREASAAS